MEYKQIEFIPKIFEQERLNDGIITIPTLRSELKEHTKASLLLTSEEELHVKLNRSQYTYLSKAKDEKKIFFSFFENDIGDYGYSEEHPLMPIRITTSNYRPVIFQEAIKQIEPLSLGVIYDKEYTFQVSPPYRQTVLRISDYDSNGKCNLIALTNWNDGGHAALLSTGFGYEVCENGMILGGETTTRRIRHTVSIRKKMEELFQEMERGIELNIVEDQILEEIDKRLGKKWQRKLEELLTEYTTTAGSIFDKYVQPMTHMLTHEEIPFSTHIVLQEILNNAIQVSIPTKKKTST